jgi:hypothetical protein
MKDSGRGEVKRKKSLPAKKVPMNSPFEKGSKGDFQILVGLLERYTNRS